MAEAFAVVRAAHAPALQPAARARRSSDPAPSSRLAPADKPGSQVAGGTQACETAPAGPSQAGGGSDPAKAAALEDAMAALESPHGAAHTRLAASDGWEGSEELEGAGGGSGAGGKGAEGGAAAAAGKQDGAEPGTAVPPLLRNARTGEALHRWLP